MALFRPAPRRCRSSLIALATIAAALAAAPKARAASYYWLGGNYDNWSQYAWNEGYTGSGIGQGVFFVDDLYFGYVGARDANNNVFNDYQRDFSISTLNFANQSWYLNGYGTLLFRNGAINVAASSPEVLVYQSLAIPYNYLGAAGTLSLNVASTSTLGLSSISGNGSLYKNGGGTATLYSSHTYDLGTNVNGGRLVDYHPYGNYRNDAELEFVTLSDRTFGGTVNGGGNFTKSGSGTLNMNGSTSWTGNTVVDEGRLILRTPQSSPSYNVKASAALEFDLGDATYGGSIFGAGSFTKSGGGTLTLSGNNSYSGGTWVNAGRLIDKNPHGAYANNATLTFDVTDSFTLDKPLTGNGTLYKGGSGSVTLAGLNTFTGGTVVYAGNVLDYSPHGAYAIAAGANAQFLGDNTYSSEIIGGGRFTKGGGGTLDFTGTHSHTGGTRVDGGTMIDHHPHGDYSNGSQLDFRIASDVLFFANQNPYQPYLMSGQGHFTKSGAGTLYLSGGLSYAGTTTVNGGTLFAFLSDNVLPTSTSLTVNAGGAFLLGGDRRQTVASLAGAGSVQFAGNNAFAVNGAASTTFSGVVSGGGSFTKSGAGTLTLSGVNTYNAGTTVGGGRLIVANPHGTYVTNADLEFQNASALSYATPITGTGNFTKSGAGVLTLTGASTYSGATTISAGTLMDGVVNALPTGTALTVNGAYDLNGFNQTVGSLAGAGTVALTSGKVLTINPGTGATYSGVMSGAGALTKGGVGTQTLSGIDTYSGGTTVNGGRLVVTNLNGAYTLGANTTLEAAKASAQSYGALISGSGAFVKSGAGTLTLTGANAYGGGTSVSGGRLIDGKPHGDYSVAASATLELPTTGTASFAGKVSGGGALVKSGAGTLTLTGSNGYSGGTTVNAGRLIDPNPHDEYVTNADLEFAKAGNYAWAKATTGTGNFTKSGAGILTLQAASTYSGATTIGAGTLKNGVANALPTTTSLDVGGAYDLGGFSQTVASLTGAGTVALSGGRVLTVGGGAGATYSGAMSGAGSLTKTGAGTQTLTGANSYSGGTTVNGGRLIVSSLQGDYVANAALEFSGTGAAAFSRAITGTGSFTRSGATGTLTLSGANAYSGGTFVNGGRIIDPNPHGSYAANGGTVEFQNANDLVWSLPITGTGIFAKSGSGTLTLTGGNVHSGGTIVRDGRLIDLNPHGASYNTASILEFRNAGDLTYANPIFGAGAFEKSGAGTLTLSGASAHTGGSTVSAGTLRVTGRLGGSLRVASGATLDNAAASGLTLGAATLDGAVRTSALTRFTGPVTGAGGFTGSGKVQFDGGYSPGNSPASVTFEGGLALGSANVLTMELGGTALGTGYDHLSVLGTATLGGALNVAYTNGFVAHVGDAFDLFDFGSSNGAFASVSLPALANGLAWNTSGLYTTGTIKVQAVPEPAALAALGLGALAMLRRRHK